MNEFELIERLFSHLTEGDDSVSCGVGDDAAILRFPPRHDLAVTTDTLVSGVHFFTHADAFDVGFKALAVNLSDLAAMAAQPRWATLCLTLPETDLDWLSGFTRGFAHMAHRYNVSLVGGDITRGPLAVTCQAMGTLPAGTGVRRSGARPGDAVYVSGRLGLPALALALLGADGRDGRRAPAACLERLQRPLPRVELGLALQGIAGAMIDLSDGLAGDLGHILEASAAGAEVDLARLPVSEDTGGLSEDRVRQLAAAGGDDYELCFTVSEGREASLRQISEEADCLVTRIGRITPGRGITWLDADGRAVDLDAESYHHF